MAHKFATPVIPLWLLLLLAGCNLRQPHLVRGVADHGAILRDYLDLNAGDRIRVITPVLKSGGYSPEIKMQSSENGVVTATSTEDLAGYETSYYSVKQRKGDGVRIVFNSAWVTRQNRTRHRLRPLFPLFDFPDDMGFVRLIYTLRVSQADHDMAIVAARDLRQLSELTVRLRTAPAEACRSELGSFCRWVPNGIGVQRDAKK